MRAHGTSWTWSCASCPVHEGTSAPAGPDVGVSPAALERAVALLRAVAPGLDPTGLADGLWLASRMGVDAPAPSPPLAPEPGPPEVRDRGPDPAARDQEVLPRPPTPAPPTHDLHERMLESGSTVAGHPLALPRASALPFSLPTTRALRPWKRPWPTGRRHSLDVTATVDNYTRTGELLPVLAPAPERWFDLTLVVDRSPSMQVWRDTIDSFARVLGGLGAFRTLQPRDLRFRSGPEIELTDRRGQSVAADRLGSSDGRRLVIVITDCAAPAWRAPEVWKRLRVWAHSAPLALLNPLPTRLWRGTGLDLPTVRVTSGVSGGINSALTFRLPPLLPRDTNGDTRSGWVPVPVLSLSPYSLERWSRTMMLSAPEGCAAVLVAPGGRPADIDSDRPPVRRSADMRTEGFLRTASPAAARLAVLSSPSDRPSLDLLRVLCQELVPEATVADLAEVISSGLFASDTDAFGNVFFRAPQEVRTRLEQELSEYDALRLGQALSRHLAAGHDGQGRIPMVADGGGGDATAFAARETPAGRALARTLELLGLPGTPEPEPGVSELAPSLLRTLPTPTADPTELALRIALALAPTDRRITGGGLRDVVAEVVNLLLGHGIQVDSRRLTREFEARLTVSQTPPDDVATWYGPDRHPDFGTTFWGRYRRHLYADRTLLESVDQSTDRLMAQLENPRRPGPWLRAGLIVTTSGVGRTAMVTGLAAKALDVGFHVIVVLTGPHSEARAQTQTQIDEGLLGFDTTYQTATTRHEAPIRPVGVGTQPSSHLEIAALTSTVSDFTTRRAAQFRDRLDALPLVLVVKKDRKVVENVRSWFVRRAGRPESGIDLPLLVVDITEGARHTALRGPLPVDEAVHGLLSGFRKAAYVGFAYPPFLPLPLPDGGSRRLYPDHFVHALGPLRYGEAGHTTGEAAPPLLPRVCQVTDHERWLPPGHKAGDLPGEHLPDSLREAVLSFLLAGTVRAARGGAGAHNSMLVSVSRFTAVQARVRDSLNAYLRSLVAALQGPDDALAHRVLREFDALGRSDFGLTGTPSARGESSALTWERLTEAASRTSVIVVNSSYGGLPDWRRSRKGLNVIAVGGTKLAQGAALEGLTVGYYLRSTSTSETLLQLNSAFGFRTGYEDVCRLYVPPEVLGRRIEEFSGARVETTRFSLSPDVRSANFETLTTFVETLGSTPLPLGEGNLVWREVPPLLVLERFLEPYLPGVRGLRETLPMMCAYVRGRLAHGELGSWTVQLVNGPGRAGTTEMAGHDVGLVERKPRGNLSEEGTYDIGVLHAPSNEAADLDQHQFDAALAETRASGVEGPTRPDHRAVRSVRRPDQALLTIYLVRSALSVDTETPLVGFALSLPRSAFPEDF